MSAPPASAPAPPQRVLHAARLLLRAPEPADAKALQRLINDPTIAAQTLTIPYPYEDGMAEAWIERNLASSAEGIGYTYLVTRARDRVLVGAIGAKRDLVHERAEIGYWIGRPFWGRGYASEAAGALLDFAFRDLACHRITAQCYTGNAASRRVLEKLGMTYEGCRPQHIKKPDGFRDVELFGLLRRDWRRRSARDADAVEPAPQPHV